MMNLARLCAFCALLITISTVAVYSQVTPPGANSDAECPGCWDLFQWTMDNPFTPAGCPPMMGTPAGSAEGVATQSGCVTIEGTVEYSGPDTTPDLTGVNVGANQQVSQGGGAPQTDTWTYSFGTPLTDPVFQIGGLFNASMVTFKTGGGAIIPGTCIASCGAGLSGPPWTGDGGYTIQLSGTFTDVVVCVTVFQNDSYTLSVGTCLATETPPAPCVGCTAGSFEYVNLQQTGTLPNPVDPTTPLPIGIITVDGVCFGSYEFEFSDVARGLDGSGTRFGGTDTDGGAFCLRMDFCEPIDIQQLDVLGLETESEISVGTMKTGTGLTSTLSGLDLTVCEDPSGRMGVEPGTTNVVISDGPSCASNPNGKYTVAGGPTSTVYFTYKNPPCGCSVDRVLFRLGVCYAPPLASAIPVCPLQEFQVACSDPAGNFGPTSNVMIDGAGNIFDGQSCGANIPAADGSGLVDLQVAVENGIALQTANLGCAEILDEVGSECNFDCVPEPTCASTTCPPNTEFGYIFLDQMGTNAGGNPMGTVLLNGAKVGTYDFLMSDLDRRNDGNGSTFGGADTDGGTMLIHLDFCTPINVAELTIVGLEVMSEVTIGTTPGLTGLSLSICDDPSGRMGVGPAPNQVITDGPGCLANPNGTYNISPATVSDLFFRYHNPPGGCTGDYVGFRIGACVAALEESIPECPLTFFEIVECPGDAPVNFVRDNNGNYYNFTSCPAEEYTMPLQEVALGCVESMTMIECNPCCQLEVTCPVNLNIGTFDCDNAVPNCPTSIAQLRAAPYNMIIGMDPCGSLVVACSDSAVPVVCALANQTILRTIVVIDDLNGNGMLDAGEESETCVFSYTFLADMTGPTITCPADVVVECSVPNTPPSTGIASATDNCSAASTIVISWVDVSTQATSGCGQFEFDITRTWTAEDNCGNISNCVQNLDIVDTTSPVVECNDLTIQLDGSGNVTLPVGLLATWFDNCSNSRDEIDITTSRFLDFDCDDLSNLGTNDCATLIPITITARDVCGNVSSCVANVTVEDNRAPTIFCPSDRVSILDPGECGQFTQEILPDFEDNCGATLTVVERPDRLDFIAISCETGESDPILYSYLVEDNCNNISACAYTVTYVAFQEPSQSLSCNDGVNITVNADCELEITADMFLEGGPYGCYDCFQIDIVNPNPQSTLGEIEVIITHPESGSSCTVSATVEDKTDPTISCDVCTDPMVSDPDCVFNCTEEELFRAGTDNDVLDRIIDSAVTVIENCPDDTPISISSRDFFSAIGDCSEGTLMERVWSVSFPSVSGGTRTLNCTQYFRFNPLSTFDDMGNFVSVEAPHDTIAPGIFEPVIDDTVEDIILMPKTVVELPNCDLGISPAEIAAFFDNPITNDDDDSAGVLENNEGIWFAYPHYYIAGDRPAGPHAQPIVNGQGVCNLIVDFHDTAVDACGPNCGGNTKTQRTWTIIDWCGSFAGEYTQLISVFDDIAPRFIFESDQIFASTDPWQCAADVPLPAPKSLIDACDADLTYYIGFVEGALEVTGNAEDGFVAVGVPVGTRQVQYVAEDCCGNRAEVLMTITVEDRTAPTPVTVRNLVVELGSINSTSPNQTSDDQGTAKIFVDAIDQGSFDNCTDVIVDIRRTGADFCIESDTIWGESVTFCCDDIDREIDVQVRVCDKNDNCNLLWSTVLVEDKQSGALVCPLNLVLPCTADIWDLDLTGVPTSFGTCMENDVILDTMQIFDDTAPRLKRERDGNPLGIYTNVEVPAYDPSCGFGAIRRIIEVGGAECEQWFVLEPVDTFAFSTIVWPEDQTVQCEFVETGEPFFVEPTCVLVGVDVVREEIEIEENSCSTILYHWTIVDWCTFDPSRPDDGGIFEWTQTIKIEDVDAPVVTSDDGLCFGVDTDECTRKGIVLSAVGTDEGNCPSAWLSWTINVDYDADWVIDCVFETTTSPTLANGDPNPKFVAKTASGEAVSIVLGEELEGNKAQHRVEWIVNDGCGNRGSFETFFTVEDKKDPTPFCLNLGTAVMAPTEQFPQGMVELWAIDFDQKSFDNCSADEDLFFTFTNVAPPMRCDAEYDNRVDRLWYDTSFWFFDSSEGVDDSGAECAENGAGAYSNGGFDDDTGVFEDFRDDIHRWVPGRRSSGAIFTGDQVGPGNFLTIPVYAWDECGNRDFCFVDVRIINNGGGAGRVAGEVRTEELEMVQDVQTELMGDIPGFPVVVMTNTTGSYAFENVLEDESYQITAEKDGDDGNGVNTIDLIMIQRHILGELRLDSPYKMIAADINNDKRINGLDLIELRKFILGVYTEFPQNDSWKFIPANDVLTLDNPWGYDEHIDVVSMTAEVLGQDFIAAKIGDLNSTATVSGVASPTEVGKVTGLLFDDRPVLAGEEVEVVLSSTQEVFGYQFTMDMSGLSLVSVTGEGVDESNVAMFDDKMTMSHGSLSSMTGDLMTLTLKADKAGQLSELLGITSDITKAEAYIGEDLEITDLRLQTRSDLAYDLGQNQPNPFKIETQITYTLPEAATATMTLYDVTGKVLQKLQLKGEKGENVVTVDRETLTTGVVYYKLESGEYTATRHMIVIE